MRFYQTIALALLLIYLFEDNVLGAPTKGRYMWVKCKPNSKSANCAQLKGPWINLPMQKDQLPPSAAKNIVPVESGEDTPETESDELSGESSGDVDPMANLPDVKNNRMNDGPVQMTPQVEEPVLEEEASGEMDYSNFVFTKRVEPKLSPEDLREDNMIQ